MDSPLVERKEKTKHIINKNKNCIFGLRLSVKKLANVQAQKAIIN